MRKIIHYVGDNAMNAQTAPSTEPQHVVPRVAEADSRFRRNHPGLLASLGFAASLLASAPALAQTAPNLGSTSTFGVVSGTFTNANTAPQTIINGNVCFTTGPTTPPLTINGTTSTPCPPQTGLDQGLALANLNGQACTSLGAGAITLDSVIIGGPPGTIPPGCYSSGGAMNVTLSTTVTLNGAGVYIFRPGGALNTGANSSVILAGGACASDVYWAPVAATTLGANAALSPTPTFVGNILDAAGISIGHFANLTGRALAFGGTVLTDANTITVPTCAAIPPPPGPPGPDFGVPTLSEWAMIMLAALLAIAGFAAMRRQAR
jgi:Ice-binding-like/IPTL-CTERM motif